MSPTNRCCCPLVCIAVVLLGSVLSAHSQEEHLSRQQQFARDLLEELIEINTTHSSGSTTIAAEAMAARLRTAGFPDSDVKVLEDVPGKGNLVVRLRGRDTGQKPLLLLAHLDVVEADPADWTVDPFTFLERDGFFYGRGSIDDKDECAIHIANLIRLKEEGFVPDRDIIVALTADEEGGDHNGVVFLLAEHRELIDAEFALNEGGDGSLKNGKRISNNVQASEKVYQSFRLEVTNPGGHSSLPLKDNAITHLAEGLVRIAAYDFPVKLNEVTRTYFERSAALVSPEIGTAMRGILQDPTDPAALEQLSPIPAYNSRLRTTCVSTMLEAGHAENALPQRARAIVTCRILPGESPDEVHGTLVRLVDNPKVSITPLDEPTPSPPSPLRPEILGAIEEVTEGMWPGTFVIPVMSTGATDGLYLRNAGIPVYGVSGIFSEIGDLRAHGQDERILARSFFEGQEFLYRLVKKLSSSRD